MSSKGGSLEHGEGRVGDTGNERRSSRVMVIVLIGLILIALGLGVGIFFARHNTGNTVDEKKEYYGAADALVASQEIWSRFEEDENYSLEEAYSDFEKLIDESNDATRNYLLVYYVDFVYEQTGETNIAIGIMENNKGSLGEDGKEEYYLTLKGLYEKTGNSEKVEECEKMIEELLPFDTRTVEEMEEE